MDERHAHARGAGASAALERGTRFLLERQGDDGLWHDFLTPAGEASEWPTGFISSVLHVAGADGRALRRARDALVVRQNADGGWGYNEDVPSDADSTACGLLFLARIGAERGACERAAACLCANQREADGGVSTYREPDAIRRFMGVGRWMRFDGWCRPHTEVTAMGARALAAYGATASVAAAWRYVRARQQVDGSWGAYWWTAPHYATLQAAELACLAGEGAAVARAAGWALRGQGADGGWSAPHAETSAFATALSLSILVLAGAAGPPLERALSCLAALQEDDGGWPSHPIMRIPLPGDADPDRHRRRRLLGRGIVVQDQHRTFTSAACVAAIAGAAGA